MENIVTELCPHCETEIEMSWDVKALGYKAYCPHCGERLMLCDACQHPDDGCADNCDYCATTDTCRHNLTNKDLDFIIAFAKESPLRFTIVREQLRSLWTAYCLHKDLEPDTQRCNRELALVQGALNKSCPSEWRDKNVYPGLRRLEFNDFMCEELV